MSPSDGQNIILHFKICVHFYRSVFASKDEPVVVLITYGFKVNMFCSASHIPGATKSDLKTSLRMFSVKGHFDCRSHDPGLPSPQHR